jgi:hypothetical protein
MVTPTKNHDRIEAPVAVWRRVFWWLLWCAPAAWVGWRIWRDGVDVPVEDQWDGTFPLFEKASLGTLSLGDFFAQHNEHRIFFPRLIMFGLGRLTHWNVRAEMGVTWLLAWICLLSFWRLACVTGWNLYQARWQVLGAAVLVFSPLAYENWLFGFQLSLVFPVACFATCLWVASSLRYPANFLFSFAVCTVCTFSVGSGFSSWLLSFPLLLLPEWRMQWTRRRIWWLLWLAGFLTTTAVYLHGYTKPPEHPSTGLAFAHPVQGLLFFLAFLGSPFAHGTPLDPVLVSQLAGAGLLAMLALVAAGMWFWRGDRLLLARALPWFGCALIAVVNGVLITIGRFGFGMGQAMASRYLPFGTPLPIALLFLVPLAYQRRGVRTGPAANRTFGVTLGLGAVASALVLLHVWGALTCGEEWSGRHRLRLAGKAVVELINVVADPEADAYIVHPRPEIVKPRANVLDHLGYLRPPLVHSRRIGEIADTNAGTSNQYGEILQSVRTPDGRWGLIGWAVLPEKGRAADAVVLTYDGTNGEPLIFTLALVGGQPVAVAAAASGSGTEHCGWGKAINPDMLAPEARLLRAWAFDAELGRAYPLKGTALVPR